MILPMLILPLMTSLLVTIIGRNIGVRGTNILVITSLLVSTIFSFNIAYEVIFTASSLSLILAPWIDTATWGGVGEQPE